MVNYRVLDFTVKKMKVAFVLQVQIHYTPDWWKWRGCTGKNDQNKYMQIRLKVELPYDFIHHPKQKQTSDG